MLGQLLLLMLVWTRVRDRRNVRAKIKGWCWSLWCVGVDKMVAPTCPSSSCVGVGVSVGIGVGVGGGRAMVVAVVASIPVVARDWKAMTLEA